MAKLQEAAQLYCLCQRLYDEDRPMLGCDYCDGWYHHECVGMPVPPSDSEEEEQEEQHAPPDWRCGGGVPGAANLVYVPQMAVG